jgi:hypothetical protein
MISEPMLLAETNWYFRFFRILEFSIQNNHIEMKCLMFDIKMDVAGTTTIDECS